MAMQILTPNKHETNGETPIKIETKSLEVFYGKFQALKQINLDVREKQITAIIGPSGCGKSTLLRSFNRMNDLTPAVEWKAKSRWTGRTSTPPSVDVVDIRRRVGMVFQRPNPFPKSIFDNVAYGPRLYGIHRKTDLEGIVENSLKASALWNEVKDKLNQSGLSISGGQQQRLCIARALAVEPEVILMDEPASALDPISTLKIEELMQELKKNYTIVIVTHNMQQAARVSDFTAMMMIDEAARRASHRIRRHQHDFHPPQGQAHRRLRHRAVWIVILWYCHPGKVIQEN